MYMVTVNVNERNAFLYERTTPDTQRFFMAQHYLFHYNLYNLSSRML